MNWSMIGRNIFYQLYGYLTRHDENMKVVPELAESWEWVDDLTLRWHLREGVEFHNGEPFNAEAMKYSIERILNEETGAPWRAVLTWIDRLEIVDEYTVDVIGQFPTTAQVLEVGRMPMLPPKYTEEVGPEAFSENPVSAGPWKFVEWVKGDRVVLERNVDYWSGAPPIERLVFRVVPEATTALAELQAGTVDIAKIAPESCDMLNESDNAHCVAARSIQNVRIMFTNDTEDLAVRKAIAHAINVDSIIENIMGGQATRSVGPLSQLVWGSNPDLPGYEYDPELSKQLLADAGYAEGDITMPLHFAEGRFAKGREVAEAIAGDLEEVGIIVEIQPKEYGVWFDEYYEGQMSGMSLSASTATTADPNQMFRDHLGDACIGYHCYPELDALLQPVKEVVEPTARQPLVTAAENFIFDNVLWIQLYDVDLIYGVSNKVDWAPVPNDLKWVLAATPR
jgi:peptide/nickel transport system substrate-binding protein